MSKTFTFERFDLHGWACDECGSMAKPRSEFDGEWVRAEDAINREAVNSDEIRTLNLRLKEAKAQWRCFHCAEVFADEAAARLHFGSTERQSPACTIDVAEYRAMEARMHRYNEEDSDLHREIAGMQSTHRTALRREEEKGYARGLAAATAALLTLDKLKYTYKQGAELWEPPAGLSIPAPIGEYHEDCGSVVWWAADEDGMWLGEPAWIGAPGDSDWPGYHTHWTFHPQFPAVPARVPLCTACEGYGRYVDGNSGTESDAFSPNIVQCDCADEERRSDCRVENSREIPKPANVTPACWCETCRPITLTDMRMVLCPKCGNKRCPHATNHVNACTNSNEPGQKGSSWERVAPPPPLTVNEREAVIRRARAHNFDVWPAQLESGVMFYYGERITRAEFEAVK